MSWRVLASVMDEFTKRYGYVPQGGPYRDLCRCGPCARDRGESVLHELAHGVLLGIGRMTTNGSVKIEQRLRRWHDRNADHHEMKAVALEILAGRAQGVRIGLSRLLNYAMSSFRYYQRSDWSEIEGQIKKYMSSEEVKDACRRITRLIARVRAEVVTG